MELKKTLTMTKGLPASGKSTWAKAVADASGGDTVRVNKDDLRKMLHNSKHSKAREAIVLEMRDALVTTALLAGKNVIVDDTNFAPQHEARLREIAALNKAEFKVDLFATPVEDCVRRDRERTSAEGHVGASVIYAMADKYLPKPAPYPFDPVLEDCVICDLDGTLFQTNGRDPYDESKVYQDTPRPHVLRALGAFKAQHKIFLSGRTYACKDQTIACMADKAHILAPELYMRAVGDHRDDAIVKRELFDTYVRGRYNVVAVFDDRPKVIRMWRDIGLGDRLFDVGTGREF